MGLYFLLGLTALGIQSVSHDRPRGADPSMELHALTSGIHELLRTSDPGEVVYRSRSVEIREDAPMVLGDCEEVIGRIRCARNGLHVTECSQRITDGQLQAPNRTESFASFYTGTSTASNILYGNPQPQVMLSEWYSMPSAWWMLIGRVPPLALSAYLVSEAPMPHSKLVLARFSQDEGSIEIEYEPEGLALRTITYRSPDGRKSKEAHLLGAIGKTKLDGVSHPLLVILEEYRTDGSLLRATSWLQMEAQEVPDPDRMIPGGTLVGYYHKGVIERQRTMNRMPIEGLESWFWVGQEREPVERTEPPIHASTEERAMDRNGDVLASEGSPPAGSTEARSRMPIDASTPPTKYFVLGSALVLAAIGLIRRTRR